MIVGKQIPALLLLGALAGCVSVTIRETPVGEVGASGSAQATILALCRGERWIGLMPKDMPSCPRATDWRSRPLFELGAGRLSLVARDVGLDRYCLYTPLGTPVQLQPPPVRLPRLDLDCRGVTIAQTPNDGNAWSANAAPALAAYTLAAIGAAPTAATTARTRLTLLDTHPTGEVGASVGTPCSHHGESLGFLARQVACRGQAPCPTTVRHRQALSTPNAAGTTGCVGGSQGFIGELGTTIYDEIEDWTQPGSTPSEDRLVLNLSLGWDGELFGGFENESQMPTPARAVYQALEVARRAGVLVLAAGGNLTPGPKVSHGPLLPAGWEPRNKKKTRVFAVSGLTSDSRPLANSRPGALARRGSFGGPAVVDRGGGNQFTPALTGSSVSTAVVSALAAATWARQPEASPAALVHWLEIHDSKELDWRADSSLDPKRHRGRHIGPGNPDRPTLVPWTGPPTLATVQGPADGAFQPTTAYFAGSAEAGPQPGADPCPNCTIDPPHPYSTSQSTSSGTLGLYVELADDWNWSKVCVRLDALELRTADGKRSFYKVTGPACWSGAGATYPMTFPIAATDPAGKLPLQDALLYWSVETFDSNSHVLGSAISVPILLK